MFIKLLNYPIVRHLLAAVSIVAMLYFFSIAPLQLQNKSLRKDLKEVTEKQHELITKLAEKDTYKIENKVDGAKIKKGGEIKLIPDNTLGVINTADTATMESKPTSYRKHWWQLWRKRDKSQLKNK